MSNSTIKELPIILRAPMVRAILDGTKTQARWIVKPQPVHAQTLLSGVHETSADGGFDQDVREINCPYGQPGDRLLVKASGLQSPKRTPRGSNTRITLEIVSVRVERVQDISEADARAEGMAIDDAIYDYSRLWESINGPGSWAANPYVWVVGFKKQ